MICRDCKYYYGRYFIDGTPSGAGPGVSGTVNCSGTVSVARAVLLDSPSCRQVWVERERRVEERALLPYEPPMVK